MLIATVAGAIGGLACLLLIALLVRSVRQKRRDALHDGTAAATLPHSMHASVKGPPVMLFEPGEDQTDVDEIGALSMRESVWWPPA
jgi:hypothetical protein